MTVNINFIDYIISIIIFILSPYSTQHLQEEKPNVSTWLLILSKKKPLGLEGNKAQQQGWTLYETLPHIMESKRQWPYNDCYLCDHDMINTTMIYEPLPHIVGPCANNLNDVFFQFGVMACVAFISHVHACWREVVSITMVREINDSPTN